MFLGGCMRGNRAPITVNESDISISRSGRCPDQHGTAGRDFSASRHVEQLRERDAPVGLTSSPQDLCDHGSARRSRLAFVGEEAETKFSDRVLAHLAHERRALGGKLSELW